MDICQSDPVTRFAHPRAFAGFIDSCGIAAGPWLASHALPTLHDDPGELIPVLKAWSLFDCLAAQSGLTQLGWLVGQSAGSAAMEPNLAVTLQNVPTPFYGLQRILRHTRSKESSHISQGVLLRAQEVVYFTHYGGLKAALGYHHSQNYQLRVYMSLFRSLFGSDWLPSQIGIESHCVPHGLDEMLPGVEILSGQPYGYILFPKALLARPVALHAEQTRSAYRESQSGYVKSLRTILESSLPYGYVSQEEVAEEMGSSVRTVTRRLSDYGLTYGMLIDALRFERARAALDSAEVRLIDVAALAGVEDQGDFTRLFKRISGLTPSEYRYFLHEGDCTE
jgi:AraC-like DNA-binding protein